METRREGRAMGTTFAIVVQSQDEHLLDAAEGLLHRLEKRWSRFLPNSEISVLNRADGAPVIVSSETFDIVRAAIEGCIATDGRFDPTVHDSLVALGYDRTLDDIEPGRTVVPSPAPGVGGIELDDALLAIRLPAGVRIDLGGIGKGTAADLICADLLRRGAVGAAASIGGDLRVVGESPTAGGWNVAINNALLDIPTLNDGAVCTSTTAMRRWETLTGTAHHLVDPRTGVPTSGLESVSVVAATAQQAEVLTKAAIVSGADAPALMTRFGVLARFVWSSTESLISV